MKKGLIISGSLAQDHEFIYPYYRLLEEGILVDVCLLEGKPVKGILGTTLPPNKEQHLKKIDELKIDDYDILVLPGSMISAVRNPLSSTFLTAWSIISASSLILNE